MSAKKPLDINKFNYRFQNYQKINEENKEKLIRREKSHTQGLIQTEFRNSFSKQLTENQPSFKKKVDKMLVETLNKFKEEKQQNELKKTLS